MDDYFPSLPQDPNQLDGDRSTVYYLMASALDPRTRSFDFMEPVAEKYLEFVWKEITHQIRITNPAKFMPRIELAEELSNSVTPELLHLF